MTIARSEIVVECVSGYYHCISRCVRRAFLCGVDGYTGRSFEHRKAWIKTRLKELTATFAVEVCAYAIMSNHLHVVIRTRPDWVEAMSDKEVARQWKRLFLKRGYDPARNQPVDPERIGELRPRLSSVSWFMRCLNEHIARKANKEDDCKGRFWEGRFKCQALLDDSAVLACMAYVDLNPIRAGLVETPEQSEFTSIYERIMIKRHSGVPVDHWLCPIGLESPADREGILDMELDDYLKLVDWTGRQIRYDKRGAIPGDIAPILERLQVDVEHWTEIISGFGAMFHLAAGRLDSMKSAARRIGKQWLKGFRRCEQAFTNA